MYRPNPQSPRNPQQADVFMSASGDCTFKIWDLRQPVSTLTVRAHQHEILSADWCKYNDCLVATGSTDKTIRLWDVRMPERELRTIFAHGCAAGWCDVGCCYVLLGCCCVWHPAGCCCVWHPVLLRQHSMSQYTHPPMC